MHPFALRQLIAAAVAEAQRPLAAELAELRAELAEMQAALGNILESRGARPKPANTNANPVGPVHHGAVGAHSAMTDGRPPGESDRRADRSWLTLAEVAALFQVSAPTVAKMIESEGLPAIRIGKQWRLRRDEIERWAGEKQLGRQHGSRSA